MRLDDRSLLDEGFAPQVPKPGYDRSVLHAGIVHIGVGNFHRAHQAMVIDELLRQEVAQDFAICGVGLLPSDAAMRDALNAQDGLYSLELRHPDGRRDARIIGSIIEYLFYPDDPEAVIEKLTDPAVRIVSLTITEGGYRLDQPAVLDDVARISHPKTAFGIVTVALQRRRERRIPAFTVMSCDNLASNGDVARKAFTSFAALADPELAGWIDENVAFPNSMVDRITPVTTDADRAHARDDLGIEDAWPVGCEPFFQWVLEDDFPNGRPPFEAAGVQLVRDVAPYELMKLRLLNASHQALAYFGFLAGYRFVDEALRDDDLVRFITAYMDEAEPTLLPTPGIDISDYRASLLSRFGNPAIRDTLARLCADTSNRIPRFLLPVVKDNLAAGRSVSIAAAICASWARYAEGVDEAGASIEVADRHRDELHTAALLEHQLPGAFLEHPLFGGLGQAAEFRAPYIEALALIRNYGAKAALGMLVPSITRAEG